MALTAEGKALTEAHRRRQIAIAAKADAAVRELWGRLNPDDLTGSTPGWLVRNVAVAQEFRAESVAVAAGYVAAYRGAELGSARGEVVKPRASAPAMRRSLELAGPARVKLLVGKGGSGAGAHGAALNKYTGIVRRQVLEGGREVIDKTTAADSGAIGYRRVTDGNPCTFCAMLASRGPVYRSAKIASEYGDKGLKYHGHCGCTAEIVYGEWQPSEREQEYIDAYEKAASEAQDVDGVRTQETVLWRMRRDGLFRDSALSRSL